MVNNDQTNGIRWRYRVGVSTSVKGVKTYDCTVEAVDGDADTVAPADVLRRSDELVSSLDQRYPPTGGA